MRCAAERLAANAEIVPVERGILARTTAGVVWIESPISIEKSEALLALLRRGRPCKHIARQLDVPVRFVMDVLRELRSLGLLARVGERSRRIEHRPRVVLAGLGPLGRAVLTELLRCSTADVWLHHAAPTERACVARWLDSLPARQRRRVRLVEPHVQSPSDPLHGAALAVCCIEQPGTLLRSMAEAARAAGVPLLPAELTPSGGVVGPSSTTDARLAGRGCPVCAEVLRRGNDGFIEVAARYAETRGLARLGWRSDPDPAVLASFAALVANHIRMMLCEGGQAQGGRALLMDPSSLATEEREVIRHPKCPLCAPAPGVPAALASSAARALTDGLEREQDPVDPRELCTRLSSLCSAPFGLFPGSRSLSHHERQQMYSFFRNRRLTPSSMMLANFHRVQTLLRDGGDIATGIDFSSVEVATTLSIVEALERTAFLRSIEPVQTLRHGWRDVAKHALDPRDLPLYAPDQYRRKELRARRFDPDRAIEWVWGVDAASVEPILVPADAVRPGGPTSLLQINSNGAACHSSWIHAALNGIYELIERDAFMVSWMNQLSLPRFGFPDDPMGMFSEWKQAGFQLEFVDLTTDLEVPVALVTCRDREDPDFFALTFAAGGSATRIASKLQRELAQFATPHFLGRFRPTDVSRARSGLAVRSLRDHAEFYQHRSKAHLLQFLTAGPQRGSIAEHDHFRACKGLGARRELEVVVARLAKHGHRVILVDLTSPWLKERGLYAVRAIIPGMQPIHFGHGNHVLGGTRLFEAPARMGVRDRPSRRDELNPWEHPFA